MHPPPPEKLRKIMIAYRGYVSRDCLMGAKSGFSLEPARTAPLGGPGNDTCAMGTRLYVALTACPAEKVAKFSKVLEKLWTCPDRPGEPSARLSRLLQPAGGTAAAIVCVCQYLPPVRTRREYTAASDPGPLQLVNSDTLFVRGFWSRLTGFAPASRCQPNRLSETDGDAAERKRVVFHPWCDRKDRRKKSVA